MAQSDFLIALNFLVCGAGLLVCVCRLAEMSKATTKVIIRVQYSVWFGLFVASAISWTYDEPATLVHLVMSSAVFFNLLLGVKAWRYGPPDYTFQDHGIPAPSWRQR